jgi:hypoxanthine phosphoribosyltransferase
VLLDKKERRQVDVPIDYIGFEVPNVFIVGYGIDFESQYRNLPFIASMVQESRTRYRRCHQEILI